MYEVHLILEAAEAAEAAEREAAEIEAERKDRRNFLAREKRRALKEEAKKEGERLKAVADMEKEVRQSMKTTKWRWFSDGFT